VKQARAFDFFFVSSFCFSFYAALLEL